MPFDGAVHDHHAVCPLETPGMTGSPISLVALESDPHTLVALSGIKVRLTNWSFCGWAMTVPVRKVAPTSAQRHRTGRNENVVWSPPDLTRRRVICPARQVETNFPPFP